MMAGLEILDSHGASARKLDSYSAHAHTLEVLVQWRLLRSAVDTIRSTLPPAAGGRADSRA